MYISIDWVVVFSCRIKISLHTDTFTPTKAAQKESKKWDCILTRRVCVLMHAASTWEVIFYMLYAYITTFMYWGVCVCAALAVLFLHINYLLRRVCICVEGNLCKFENYLYLNTHILRTYRKCVLQAQLHAHTHTHTLLAAL